MKKINLLLVAACSMLFACQANVEKKKSDLPLHPDVSQEVNAVYNKMSWEERVAQLCGIRPRDVMVDGKFNLELAKEKMPYGAGHVCQFAAGYQWEVKDLQAFVKEFQQYHLEHTNCQVPALFHEEAIAGFANQYATVFPQSLGLAATWNPVLAAEKTKWTAQNMKDCGARMALSPVLDVVRNCHFNRVEETYGEDAYLVSNMGLGFVKGLQGDDLRNGVAACTKHFLGYGGGEKENHNVRMMDILMPHEMAIKEGGSQVVMTSYHSVDGVRSVWNEYLIKDLLEDYIGFDGMVISDYGSVTLKGKGESERQTLARAIRAINAGNDVELSTSKAYPMLVQAMKDGKVDEAVVERSVKRVLTIKARLGLLDKNVAFVNEDVKTLDSDEARQVSYKLASQSIVLLKNNGVLPLVDEEGKAARKKIALVGPNANSFWAMLGDYTYQGMSAFWFGGNVDPNKPKIVDLNDALAAKLPTGMSMKYSRGCDWNAKGEAQLDTKTHGDPRILRMKNMMKIENADPTNWKEAIRMASKQDVIVAAMGENITLVGEGRRRKGGIALPGDQHKFVEALIKTGKPVVLVLFGARPLYLDKLQDKCAAIVECFYPGEEGGNAVADVLLGKVNPSGRLPISYPATNENKPFYYGENPKEYKKLALFPFGYGLSYSSFDYKDMKVNFNGSHCGEDLKNLAITKDGYLNVSVEVSNTSKRAGTEVVQLYFQPMDWKLKFTHRANRLIGFSRVPLQANETKTVSFKVPMEMIATYDDARWKIQPGKYRLAMGHSATDIDGECTIELTGETLEFLKRSEYLTEVTAK